jgi:sepiapterin reductase
MAETVHKRLVAVSGCSRGLGRSICQQLWKRQPSDTVFILFASHLDHLQSTVESVFQCYQNPVATKNASIQQAHFKAARNCRVVAVGLDLSLPSHHYESDLCQLWVDCQLKSMGDILFIHNAGSLGPLREIRELYSNARSVDEAIQVNVSSIITMTSTFMHTLIDANNNLNDDRRVQVVNISSLAAIQPFYSWSVYCLGKAAREHFMACLLHEYEQRIPLMKVLNYSPGPLDTDMQLMIRETMVDCPLRQQFNQMHSEGFFFL